MRLPPKHKKRNSKKSAATGPPVRCPVDGCGKTLSNRGALKKHERTVHLKIKQFKCEYHGCRYLTSEHADLKAHINAMHTKEIKYECPHDGCAYSTYRKNDLSKHQRTVHSPNKNGKAQLSPSDHHHFASNQQSTPPQAHHHNQQPLAHQSSQNLHAITTTAFPGAFNPMQAMQIPMQAARLVSNDYERSPYFARGPQNCLSGGIFTSGMNQ